jgi:hypothetical protein
MTVVATVTVLAGLPVVVRSLAVAAVMLVALLASGSIRIRDLRFLRSMLQA